MILFERDEDSFYLVSRRVTREGWREPERERYRTQSVEINRQKSQKRKKALSSDHSKNLRGTFEHRTRYGLLPNRKKEKWPKRKFEKCLLTKDSRRITKFSHPRPEPQNLSKDRFHIYNLTFKNKGLRWPIEKRAGNRSILQNKRIFALKCHTCGILKIVVNFVVSCVVPTFSNFGHVTRPEGKLPQFNLDMNRRDL